MQRPQARVVRAHVAAVIRWLCLVGVSDLIEWVMLSFVLLSLYIQARARSTVMMAWTGDRAPAPNALRTQLKIDASWDREDVSAHAPAHSWSRRPSVPLLE